MKRYLLMIVAIATVCLSCERRELLESSEAQYIRVYLNEDIDNVTTGFYNGNDKDLDYETPDVMRFLLFDKFTDKLVTERFLRDRKEDARGVYYEGYITVPPGSYKVLAYNFDTESCIINGYSDYSDAYVYTSKLTTNLSKAGKAPAIVSSPDCFFLVKDDNVRINHSEEIQVVKSSTGDWFTAENIVSFYYMQIKIKGMEWVTSSAAVVSGMEGSVTLSKPDVKRKDPVYLYLEMHPGKDRGQDVMYANFSTFGRTPDGDVELTISFDFLTTHGGSYKTTIDISEYFKTPDANDNNWILIDEELVMPDPVENPNNSGGMFDPSVGEWEDEESDVEI